MELGGSYQTDLNSRSFPDQQQRLGCSYCLSLHRCLQRQYPSACVNLFVVSHVHTKYTCTHARSSQQCAFSFSTGRTQRRGKLQLHLSSSSGQEELLRSLSQANLTSWNTDSLIKEKEQVVWLFSFPKTLWRQQRIMKTQYEVSSESSWRVPLL